MKKTPVKKVLKEEVKKIDGGNSSKVVSEYHSSKGTKGSIINKALGGRFG